MNPQNLIPYQFKPGMPSANPNGRPKKIYSILKQSGFSKDDMHEAMQEIGWQRIDQLHEILEDPTKPVILKVIARAFIKGAERGDFRYVSEILAHVIGIPSKKQDALPDEITVTLNIGEVPAKPKEVTEDIEPLILNLDGPVIKQIIRQIEEDGKYSFG
jgi:hypothetical protein